ncbi:MAG: hypothetical protein HYW77_00770 [Parcubacteria group bacterium]|nr:hypothetical protein [Parcubacteria group bacterium]
MLRIKRLIYGSLINVALLAPILAWGSSHEELPPINLEFDNLLNIIARLSCWGIRVAMFFMVIVLLLYGWQTMTSREADALAKTKQKLLWAFVGAIVIFGAFILVETVAAFIGYDDFSLGRVFGTRCQ